MESHYAQWLRAEENWMVRYQKKTLAKLAVTGILTPVFLALFLGLLPLTTGGGRQEMLRGALGGLLAGVVVMGIVFLCLLPGLSSKRISRAIEKEVKGMALNEVDTEQLGKEMLAALQDPRRVLDFEMVGPNSDHTPARFILTPHYACLQGGFPLIILVRLGDIAEIRPSEEQNTAITWQGRTRTTRIYTLYILGFYERGRSAYGLEDEDLPDISMAFFSWKIRDKVLWMLQNPPASQ